MPYVFVRENAIKYWCTVQGLNHNEVYFTSYSEQKQTISNFFDFELIFDTGNPYQFGQCQKDRVFLFLKISHFEALRTPLFDKKMLSY